ncbi:PqqD family peptide modification chaperone [Thermodesulfobacteriota bacterium]
MIFHMRSNILTAEFDDQILLFDPVKNLPYVLNGVAAFILSKTDGIRSDKDIAEEVLREFSVEYDEALADIKNLYAECIDMNIVIKENNC